jgi:uncharacterized protein
VIGNSSFLHKINPEQFTDDRFGLPTVQDILAELDKPGRDPRPEFKTAEFKEGVEEIKDLEPGMILEGVVTNVTNFGAFVDIGVHQDGLVHISALSNEFVKDPRTVVKAGDLVKVKVMSVEIERKRIALSMRLDDPLPGSTEEKEKTETKKQAPTKPRPKKGKPKQPKKPELKFKATGAIGEALAQALKKKNG